MNTAATWGWGWAAAAYVVTWGALLAYARYVTSRAREAEARVRREESRLGAGA